MTNEIDLTAEAPEMDAVEAPQEQSQEPVQNDAVADDATPEEGQEAEVSEQEAATEAESTPFPKKAVNALSRRDKTIARLKAENQRLRQPVNEPKVNNAPSEDDYATYGEFMDAKNGYAIDKRFSEFEKTQQDNQNAAQNQVWVQERQAVVEAGAIEAAKSIPDYAETITQNEHILAELPENVSNLFLEVDNGAVAFYNLAKEGMLELLPMMSPTQAAMAVGRAADMNTPAPQKRVTNAPAPMRKLNGTGDSTKSTSEMNADEVGAFFGI